MDITAIQEEIDGISILLYQNREQEGIDEVSRFFGKMKELTEELLQKNLADHVYIGAMYKIYQELLLSYENRDMLGMADCLQEYALIITDIAGI